MYMDYVILGGGCLGPWPTRYLGYALDAELPYRSSVICIANTLAPWVADVCTLSASQSTASGPLHRGDRTLFPLN